MTTPDDAVGPPGRGGREALRWRKFVSDPAAVYERARREPIRLGVHTPQQLGKHGVGVPPLWNATNRLRRSTPLDIRAFQTMIRPPASCLWVAASTRSAIFASLHVEFVGEIARVCEARDIRPDGPMGHEYVLSVEPAEHAIGRCLDVAGFAAGEPAQDLLARVRAWCPWTWTADKHGRAEPHVVPEEQLRNLVVRFEQIPGSAPVVTEQRRENIDDVPMLPDSPTRDELRTVLDALLVA